jgi:hypothetical protein
VDLKKQLMLKKIKEIFTNTGPKTLVGKNINSVSNINNLNQIFFKSYGNLNKDKIFYVIRRIPTAGFFSNITFILNNLKICEEMKFIPIIDMEYYPSLYNELKIFKNTKNSWEYYFEKLNKYSLNEVYNSKNVYLSPFTFQKEMSIDMTNNRISKYINRLKVKKEILNKINNFSEKNFIKKNKILGVHFRGSTYKTARGHGFPLTIDLMIKNIETLIQNFNYEKIFLVTEEQKYLDALKKKFKNKIIFYNSFRMGQLDSFKIYPRKNHRYHLGEEILIETILLSKCDGLTFIKSNVTSAAILFAKKQIKLHEVYLGLNTRNKFFSKYLWLIKSMLPNYLGGLKYSYKKK